jgi:pSer/pThr/pTyr-binding forkhead associated (FHA) protein
LHYSLFPLVFNLKSLSRTLITAEEVVHMARRPTTAATAINDVSYLSADAETEPPTGPAETSLGPLSLPGAEGQLFGVEGLPQGSALLVVKRGPNAGARFLLDQATTTAGRHPNSDIFLDEITVSRRHAQFRRVSGELHVVDVGSLNGTYVNREPVDEAVLANGDEVQIGKFRLLFLTGPRTGDTEGVTG